MPENRFTKLSAINALASRGRDIVTVPLAQDICEPFGLDVRDLKVVYKAEAGTDFSSRAERWEGGEMVNICTLAWVLADKLEAPEIKYRNDFLGAGRRADALTHESCLRLRLYLGKRIHPPCASCGEYNKDPKALLCFPCQRDEADRLAVAYVNVIRWSDDAHPSVAGEVEYEARKGSLWGDRYDTLEEARAEAAEWNRADSVEFDTIEVKGYTLEDD